MRVLEFQVVQREGGTRQRSQAFQFQAPEALF